MPRATMSVARPRSMRSTMRSRAHPVLIRHNSRVWRAAPSISFETVNEFAAVTHPGAREGDNQDVVGWDVEHQLWFVADGMGGYSRGQEASRLVKETLLAQIGQMDLPAAVLKAHEVVSEAAQQGEGDHR